MCGGEGGVPKQDEQSLRGDVSERFSLNFIGEKAFAWCGAGDPPPLPQQESEENTTKVYFFQGF